MGRVDCRDSAVGSFLVLRRVIRPHGRYNGGHRHDAFPTLSVLGSIRFNTSGLTGRGGGGLERKTRAREVCRPTRARIGTLLFVFPLPDAISELPDCTGREINPSVPLFARSIVAECFGTRPERAERSTIARSCAGSPIVHHPRLSASIGSSLASMGSQLFLKSMSGSA